MDQTQLINIGTVAVPTAALFSTWLGMLIKGKSAKENATKAEFNRLNNSITLLESRMNSEFVRHSEINEMKQLIRDTNDKLDEFIKLFIRAAP